MACYIGNPGIAKNGTRVDSNLWNDIKNTLAVNGLETNRTYKILTDPSVVDILTKKFEVGLDENGEIVLADVVRQNLIKTTLGKVVEFKNKPIQNSLEEKLNKVNSSTNPYSELMENVSEFNRNSPYNNDYYAYIIPSSKNKYEVRLVEKSNKKELIHAKQQFKDTIQNITNFEKLQTFLQSLGYAVSFNENQSEDSIWLGKNGTQTANGLKIIATVAGNESMQNTQAVEQAMVKVVGKVIVELEGNSMLVKRLYNYMDYENGENSFSFLNKLGINIGTQEEIDGRTVEENRQLAAAIMIGKYICNQYTNEEKQSSVFSQFVKFLSRIWNGVARLFNNKLEYINRFMKEAELIAEQIVNDIADNSIFVEAAASAENQELIYHETTFEERKQKEIMNKLNTLHRQLETIDRQAADKISKIMSDVEKLNADLAKDYTQVNNEAKVTNLFLTQASLGSIATVLKDIIDELSEGGTFASAITRWNNAINDTSKNHDQELAKDLRVIDYVVSATEGIRFLINKSIEYMKDPQNIQAVHEVVDGKVVTANLYKLRDTLNQLLDGSSTIDDKGVKNSSGLISTVYNMRRQFNLKLMEHIYGAKYINGATKKVFSFKNGMKQLITADPTKLYDFKDGKAVDKMGKEIDSFEMAFQTADNDIGMISKLVWSMGNSGDLVLQTMDMLNKQQKFYRNQESYRAAQDLIRLRDKAIKLGLYSSDGVLGYKMDKLYETYPGSTEKTGNLISEVNYGQWELEMQIETEKAYDEFKQSNEYLYAPNMSVRRYKWQAYKHAKLKAWHKHHSVFNADTKTYEPKAYYDADKTQVAYANSAYANLSDDEKKFLKECLDFKQNFDSMLPENATRNIRAPQFLGTFTNKIQNVNVENKNIFTCGIKQIETICKNIRDLFVMNCEDTDFGTDNNFNSLEDEELNGKFAYENDKVNKLPLYGINKHFKKVKDENGIERKRTDMSRLSTDLIGSLYGYAAMAVQYNSMQGITNVLEEMCEALRYRKTASGTFEKERNIHTNIYERAQMFMRRQVYGKKYKKDDSVVLKKTVGILNKIAILTTLGFNIAGGKVNRISGDLEMWKEATVEQWFTRKNLLHARMLYASPVHRTHWWQNLIPAFTGKRETFSDKRKVDAFSKYFDVTNKTFSTSKDWHTRRRKFLNWDSPSEIALSPYAIGEEYMQTMAFLARALHETVWKVEDDGTLTAMSLWDAYEVINLSENGDGILRLKEGTFIRDFSKQGPNELKSKAIEVKDLKNLKIRLEEYREEGKQAATNIKQSSLNVPGILSASQNELMKKYGLNYANVNDAIEQIEDLLSPMIIGSSYEIDFKLKAQEISNRCHGIYNEEDAVALSNSLVGQSFLLLKGWALGQSQRLFQPASYNNILETNVEGVFQSMVKNILSLRKACEGGHRTLGQALIGTLMTPYCPAETLRKWGYADYEIYNLRRSWMQVFFMFTTQVLATITYCKVWDDGDDDDEDDKLTEEDIAKNNEITHDLMTNNFISPAYLKGVFYYRQLDYLKTAEGVLGYLIQRAADEQASLFSIRGSAETQREQLLSILPLWLTVGKNIVPEALHIVHTDLFVDREYYEQFLPTFNESLDNLDKRRFDLVKTDYKDMMNVVSKYIEYKSSKDENFRNNIINYDLIKQMLKDPDKAWRDKLTTEEKKKFNNISLRKLTTDKNGKQEFKKVEGTNNAALERLFEKYTTWKQKEQEYNDNRDIANTYFSLTNEGKSQNAKGYYSIRRGSRAGSRKIESIMPSRFGKQVLNIKRTTDTYNNMNTVTTGFIDRAVKQHYKKAKVEQNKKTTEE